MSYDAKPVKAPRLTGTGLRLAAALAETPGVRGVLARSLMSSAGITAFRENLPAGHDGHPLRAPLPGPTAPAAEPALDLTPLAALAAEALPEHAFETAADFTRAYRERRCTPSEVAERVLEASRRADEHAPPLRILVAQHAEELRALARASAERWAHGAPLSPLDGVPVAVKDELDQAGYPTTVGTRFLGRRPAVADAGAVAPLRRAGALLIGKANMHEIGIGVTGINPHHGAARNPYDPARVTGGSSSGPAAAVAAGLCPIAVGADGGGSIRIPAALCGVVGLKPTFGRVSEHGAAPLCWSVAHVGPIGAAVADVALGYALMAGPDPADPNSLGHPAPTLDGLGARDLAGVRLGLMRPWFEDASAGVVQACRAALDVLRAAGATIVDLDIPELDLVRPVHLITIVSEMAASQREHLARHRADYGSDTRLNLALGEQLTAVDYVNAQRHRARLCAHFDAALVQVDAIVTPATACTAPLIAVDALATGESNLEQLEQIMRFAPAGNLTGLPAISVPAGYDEEGLPVGLQMMGRAWQEALLLRLAAAVERGTHRAAPKVSFRLLR
jgi:Asp-tRNA(Asn)/Glu-tRNA(Gln) amidotransferase A subunit family amidase